MRFRLCKRIVVGVANDVMNNNILLFAAALSYYFVLAFFPALVALGAFVAYLPIPNLLSTIITTMARVAPPESMELIRRSAADVLSPSRGALLSAGLVGTLWTCSSGFSAAIDALNVAYDVSETRPIWKTRLLALGLTFVFGILVTVAFAFMIVGPRFGEFLAATFGLTHAFALIWPILRYVLSVIFVVVALEALYLLAPNLRQRLTAPLPGAILAVIGWIFLSDALSFYFRSFAHLNRTYGVLGGGVALLSWLYWTAFLILLGAELNSEILHQQDRSQALEQLHAGTVKPVAKAKATRPAQPRAPLQ
jgi:membrane protein